MMAALAAASGAEVVAVVRSGDDPDEWPHCLPGCRRRPDPDQRRGLRGCLRTVRQLRADLEFYAVAMQPGKPQGLGRVDGVPLLAFPGNPVSSFVSFVVFGRPLLDALSGLHRRHHTRIVRAAIDWTAPPARRQYLPVTLEETPSGTLARPSHRRGSGSHLIASLHLADALAVVPAEQVVVTAGEPVTVMEV